MKAGDRVRPVEIREPEAWLMWGWTVEHAAAKHGVTVPAILGRKRTRLIAAARDEAIMSLRGSGLSLSEVGRLMGRDHSSVVDAVKRELGR